MENSPNRIVAVIAGAIFVLIGLLGFFVTSSVAFVSTQGALFLGFEVNPLHNIVHILLGGILLYAGMRSVNLSKRVNTSVGAIFLIVGIIGLFVTNTEMNILALNTADNILHFVAAVLLLAVGLALDKGTSTSLSGSRNNTGPQGGTLVS